MALQARRRRVLPGQRERGLGSVIEFRAVPIDGGVAELAIQRESSGCMIRIVGALVIRQMA